MSHSFANLTGQGVKLNVGGVTKAQLPAGYFGQINLVGNVEVVTDGYPQVSTTNQLSATGPLVVTGVTVDNSLLNYAWYTYDGTNIQGGGFDSFPPGPLTTGVPIYFENYGNGWLNMGNIPLGTAATLNVVGTYPDITFQWTVTTGPQTNSVNVTNWIGGTNLGTYEAAEGLRMVSAGPAGLELQDYGRHVEFFFYGLALVFFVETCRFIYRLISNLAGEGD